MNNAPTTFPCKFCQANLLIGETFWDKNDQEIYNATCHSCHAVHELLSNGEIISFYLTHGDFFIMFEEGDSFTLSTVDDDYNEHIILTLPYWPDNITPNNLEEKIRLFKTFG
jgi:transcription elongation factor Elf1